MGQNEQRQAKLGKEQDAEEREKTKANCLLIYGAGKQRRRRRRRWWDDDHDDCDDDNDNDDDADDDDCVLGLRCLARCGAVE